MQNEIVRIMSGKCTTDAIFALKVLDVTVLFAEGEPICHICVPFLYQMLIIL